MSYLDFTFQFAKHLPSFELNRNMKLSDSEFDEGTNQSQSKAYKVLQGPGFEHRNSSPLTLKRI